MSASVGIRLSSSDGAGAGRPGRAPRGRRGLPEAAALAVAGILVTILASPAVGQDRRQQLTGLIEEARLKVEKASGDTDRKDALDQLEAYRHELGYRDSNGQRVAWDVSYQKTLLARLSEEVAAAESGVKGAWGLLPLSDDVRRAWRHVARSLLRRADEEEDENERLRYGFAGMLLAHNTDVLDALAAEIAKVEEARKAVADGEEFADRRKALDRGINAGRSLMDLGRRAAEGRATVGQPELGSVRQWLSRIQEAVEDVRAGTQGVPAAGEKSDEEYLKQADDLEARAGKFAGAHAELSENLVAYLGQVRFGLGHAQARPLAITLLDSLRTAVEVVESVEQSQAASAAYRQKTLARLGDAVKRVANRDERAAAYRDIRSVQQDDRMRRRHEALPVGGAVKAGLWQGYEQANEVAATSQNEDERRRAENLRGALSALVGRMERLYAAESPTMRALAAPYHKGLKELESRLADLGKAMKAGGSDLDRKCWQAVGAINDLDLIRQTDDLLITVGRYTTAPPPSVRETAAEAAVRLVDDQPADDEKAREVLVSIRNSFGLLTEFQDTTLAAADMPEAARISKGKYYAAFKAQTGRMPVLAMKILENDYQERDYLQRSLPLYRMMAEWMILRRAAERGDLHRMRAARQVTVDPDRLQAIAREGSDRLAEAFAGLATAKPQEVAAVAQPVRYRERITRTGLSGLLELRRDKESPERLQMVLDNLQRASQADPTQDTRDRWRANWHANQAMEAYGQGYERTAIHHGTVLGWRNPLLGVPLLTPEERK